MLLSIKDGSVYLPNQNDSLEILKDINIEINRNKFISIIGHSGCGKTTLLRVLAGLQNLTYGKINIENNLVTIGWVPQTPTLLPNKNLLDNITFPLVIKGSHQKLYALELIKKYGLNNFVDYYPNKLSGGMKQKASIIRALVNKPELLLMDEPFASIDLYSREILNIDLANKLRSEKVTTVLVTHSIEEAVFLSDEILIMKPKIPSTIVSKLRIILPNKRNKQLKNNKKYTKYVAELREILFSLSSNYYD